MDTFTLHGTNSFALVTEQGIVGVKDDELFFVNAGSFSSPSVRPATVDDAFAACGPSVIRIPLSQIISVSRNETAVSPLCDPPNYSNPSLPTPEDAETVIGLIYNLNPNHWRREECKTPFWIHHSFPALGAVSVACFSLLAFKYSVGGAPNAMGRNRRRAELLAVVAQAIGPIGVAAITIVAAAGVAFWCWKTHQTYRPFFTVLERKESSDSGAA